jgi:DNA-binding IclR family transcriptional regulator
MQHAGSSTARHAILSRLVEELGETCNITVLDGSQVLYLDRVESPWPLRVHLQSGSRVPLTCTASGKLFLARLPKLRRDRLLAQMRFERHTDRTLVDRADLEQELERIRRSGYAVDNEEFLAGLLCVAVPVIDARGRAIAAVAVQAPVARLPRERAETTLPALERAARALAATYATPATRAARNRASARARAARSS